MVDWKASVRGWLLRDQEQGGTYPIRVSAKVIPTQPPETTNPFLQMLAEEGYSP